MYNRISNELLEFIEKSPSCFHVIDNIKQQLINEGFIELHESEKWNIEYGKKYFVSRNFSSVIAFKVGKNLDNYSFNIVASHSDSPTFKIKENYKVEVNKKYMQLNTEKYGGMILSSWLDRPLSIAGRVVVKSENQIVTKLVNVDRDFVLIPNLAIHINKEVNSTMKFNEQVDMLPLYGMYEDGKDNFMDIISECADVEKENVLSTDLFLYNRMKGSIWGSKGEFISAPKLDDLQCAYSSLKGFLKGKNDKSVNVYCCFDNEEVGSHTKQGAASTFIEDTLKRLNTNLEKTNEDYYRALSSSFMLSADNAHAVHPNHPEKSDPTNRVFLNEGVVIKFNANQKYTTDGLSAGIFKDYCNKAGVNYQSYTNRSDLAGGSTLGNILTTKISIDMVDIGLPQLAMHSSYETAGIKDTYSMIKVIEVFYNSHIEKGKEGVINISHV